MLPKRIQKLLKRYAKLANLKADDVIGAFSKGSTEQQIIDEFAIRGECYLIEQKRRGVDKTDHQILEEFISNQKVVPEFFKTLTPLSFKAKKPTSQSTFILKGQKIVDIPLNWDYITKLVWNGKEMLGFTIDKTDTGKKLNLPFAVRKDGVLEAWVVFI